MVQVGVMTQEISFFVDGQPVAQGSKVAVPINAARTSWRVKDQAAERLKPWRQEIATIARMRMQQIGAKPFPRGVPVQMTAQFYFLRPKHHYGTGKNENTLKENAPKYHMTKPDRTKILRAVEDALTGICYADDSQVVAGPCEKLYGEHQGVFIKLQAIG